MSNKVITDDILKKAITELAQLMADNCFEFTPYSSEEIDSLFSLTPEEEAHLTDLITDETVISKYKLWSSYVVNKMLSQSKAECNDYTDKMLTNISNISIKYVDTLPTSDISTSTIYILKNTGGGNDTLNLYDDTDGTWAVIGDFTISLDDYYKKSEMDTKLGEKANKTEVLLQDKIQTTAGNETHDNVYSAQLVKTELGKKANDNEVVKKTDIRTTIDSTSTNDKVVGAKAIWDKYNVIDRTEAYNNVITNPLLVDVSNAHSIYNKDGIVTRETTENPSSFIIPSDCSWGIREIFWKSGGNLINKLTGMDLNNKPAEWVNLLSGNDTSHQWSGWKRVCTTSVADVPVTTVDLAGTDIHGTVKYLVKSGICYVTAWGVSSDTAKTSYILVKNGVIPKPIIPCGTVLVDGDASQNGKLVGQLYADETGALSLHIYPNAIKIMGHGSFSYLVAES